MEKKKIKQKTAWYIAINSKLYRKSLDGGPLQACISIEEGKLIHTRVHTGMVGSNQEGKVLALQEACQRYYWPTLRREVEDIARSYGECQEHQNIQRKPSTTMTCVTTMIPFA